MRTLFLATLVFATVVFGGEWVATWNPNTEADLAGYQFYWIDEGEIGKTETLGKVTEYRFTAGDSVCAWLRAYDEAGNISEPSETVCVKKAGVPIPGDPNLVYCDTLLIPYPVEVVKWDTLKLYPEIKFEKGKAKVTFENDFSLFTRIDTAKTYFNGFLEKTETFYNEFKVAVKHDTTIIPEHPRVQFTDGKLVGVITSDSIKIERNDLLRLQYLDSKEDFLRRIDIKLKNLPCPEPEKPKTDWLKYVGYSLGGLAVILLFINIFRDRK